MTQLRAASATDVGRVRASNEDCAVVGDGLFAVADGMGGHVGGEVAARVALEVLQSNFGGQRSLEALRQAVGEANRAVWERSQNDQELRGMGTTLTALAVVAGTDGREMLGFANVGDSRAYVSSNGRVAQVTNDHSLAEEKVRQGQMSQAEAAVSPHRHILTRALGVAPTVDVDLWELELHAGDRVLLCSDGLTNEVGDDEIAHVLSSVSDPSDAVSQLVDAANRNGGNDNITVVVVDVVDGPGAAPPAPEVAEQNPTGEPSGDPGSEPLAGGGAAAVGAETGGLTASAEGNGSGGPATAATGGPPAGRTDTRLVRAGAIRTDVTQLTPAVARPRKEGTPLARASAGTAVAERPRGPAHRPDAGADRQSRRARRRALGIPRRITFRVVGFVLLLAGVVVGAYAVLHWYATDNWYVTVKGDQLVVYQGRPGGIFWFHPRLVDRTGVTTSEVLPDRLAALRADVEEPNLAEAKSYVANLHEEYESLNGPAATGSASPGTTSTAHPAGPTTVALVLARAGSDWLG